MAINLAAIPVTILNGVALSADIGLGDGTLCGIAMPAAWTPAGLSFQASVDNGATWLELQTSSAAVAVTAAQGQFIALDPAIWRGVNYIRVRSGTSASPVNQGADRVLTLITRRM
ncbi:hypothetical protein [Bradyrhizobium sp. SRS-191]|uniref:hypothetical protein n=1 Tax=Bradyrhizobium sp. SRS-191 TaxID=2962606 RepID=UPI00211E08FA|nr:hypothetical protein [Bradyrhizobium sp. SRS-191]